VVGLPLTRLRVSYGVEGSLQLMRPPKTAVELMHHKRLMMIAAQPGDRLVLSAQVCCSLGAGEYNGTEHERDIYRSGETARRLVDRLDRGSPRCERAGANENGVAEIVA